LIQTISGIWTVPLGKLGGKEQGDSTPEGWKTKGWPPGLGWTPAWGWWRSWRQEGKGRGRETKEP
jgi:hypothetical protein